MNHSKLSQNKSIILGLCLPAIAAYFTLKTGTFSLQPANAKQTQSFQLAQQSSSPSEKVRIAILDFDFSSVSNPSYLSLFPAGSKGVSDILVNRLVKSGNFVVVERSQLEAILREQDLGDSGRVDASTAAKIGRILGVEAVVIGSVTQFDVQQRRSGGGFLGFGAASTDTDALVKLNIRVVNTTTAEILFVAEGNGNESQSDTQVSVLGIGGGSSTSNEGKLLTKATEKAIDQVITELNTKSTNLAALPKALPSVNATVADVTGNTVILNKGQSDGYRVGMKLSIERVTKQVKDPTTGKVIRSVTQPLGMIQLVDVDATSSVGKITTGGKFKVGDIAKPAQ
ncbi:Curli production assembly/transport component CsgG [Trichormus variabilis ATCC 29413]|uniref:Curli production assembly/transport component CsgG n=2 Tax=Anabaena variabilis TaxID=264691 RepID=Q3M6Y6_TRIV2|nr:MULTISPECIES: CsgG/HfaB family protein [Nostocaceae]ABA23250.1 Curli production assembly/transport component CsgG [Trichormus variabilis ATCC 29413]MBC1217266.1 CsgG/HfaB family protein [Trichormus variabilis ARAD]MBC1258441.1 CsgG/HfaB family protein [Trichormus variabilis V5]MBC1266182.1 CsgG/HfaB family protein [Trichormus variabilis FSR]MBC1305246.1 CsgG/HfaB family protein [Trichormus variabilis N2B]